MRHRHFTLIELLTVIAIIAILAGLTFGGLNYASSKAARDKTLSIMLEFEDALENYKKDYGVYPICKTAAEVDFTHSESNTTWDKFTNYTANKRKRPYMEGADGKLRDAYGNAFFYQYPNDVDSRNTNKFALWSVGDDEYHGDKKTNSANNVAKAGEGDDICNWKNNQ